MGPMDNGNSNMSDEGNDTKMERVSEVVSNASECEVQAADETWRSFSSIYKDQRTIVLILRHFACYPCRDYVSKISKAKKEHETEFGASGSKLVAIGCGEPKCIQTFIEDTGFDGEMYTDPSLKLHTALGLNHAKNLFSLIRNGPSNHQYVDTNFFSGIAFGIKRMIGSGFGTGDKNQLGAEFVLGPGNQVHFSHLSQSPFDLSSIDVLFQKAGVIPENRSDSINQA